MNMRDAVKNMVKHTGIELKNAVRMATYNPAKVINISNWKGQIKEGKDADIIVFDNNINIKLTIIDGELEYDNLL